MAASVLYTNFGGMLIQEDRGGTVRTYAHDEMGNTSYLLDDTSVTDSYEYTPYGQVSHTGSAVTPFTFIGALGYFATGWSFLTSYVRARWYSSVSGNWGSVDPFWPSQKAYQYAEGDPELWVDPSGNCAAFVGGPVTLGAVGIAAGVGCAGGFIGSAVGSFLAPNGPDPAWACKAGMACLMAGLTAASAACFGPIGGCVAGALTGLLGQVLNVVCDNLVTGCEKNPWVEVFGSICKAASALLSAILSCISGLVTSTGIKSPNAGGTRWGGWTIDPNTQTMTMSLFGLALPPRGASFVSGAARGLINRLFGTSCPEVLV